MSGGAFVLDAFGAFSGGAPVFALSGALDASVEAGTVAAGEFPAVEEVGEAAVFAPAAVVPAGGCAGCGSGVIDGVAVDVEGACPVVAPGGDC